MDELAAKFLPMFIKIARTRVQVATTAATSRDREAAPTTVRELHALAGEAGLLGLRDVVPLARDCEQKAKALRSSDAEADVDALIAALHELARVIDRIAASAPPPRPV
jgi:HPt (histidine-containing phosphotransfer) domain-containing protein